MSWGMTAVAGATLVGSVISSNAARSAADKQSGAARNAMEMQQGMYNQQRADQEPWRKAGATALGQMSDPSFQHSFGAADFQQDPGYQFRLNEGNKALERAARSRGLNSSGGTIQALTRYGQDYASNEYGNAYNRFNTDQSNKFNRLASIAGVGQTATNQVGQAGMNMANQNNSNIIGAGNAQAAGTVGQANAINSGIGTGINSWMNYTMMNRAFPQQKTTNGPGSASGGYWGDGSGSGTGGGYQTPTQNTYGYAE